MNEERQTALAVKRILDMSAQQVPEHIQARLDLAIAQAVTAHAQRSARLAQQPMVFKTPSALLSGSGLSGWLGRLGEWFNRPALSLAVSAVFVVGTAVGVAKYGTADYDAKLTETVDLDAAILADDLPPDAYLDKGFVNFTTQKVREVQLPADDTIDQWIQDLSSHGQTSI